MKNITLILFFTSLSIVGFCQNDTSYAIIDSIPAGSELKGESEYETPKEIDIKAFNYREKLNWINIPHMLLKMARRYSINF